MRPQNLFLTLLLFAFIFISIGDQFLPPSLARISTDTRTRLNQLLKTPIAKTNSPSSPVSEPSPTPRKSYTDAYFDRALEKAEKMTNAVEE